MTLAELVLRLREISDQGPYDPEAQHVDADEALLKYIDDPEVSRVYGSIRKWYA